MASAEEQSHRNKEIVARHAAGAAVVQLADAYGLSISRVKEIVRQGRTFAGPDAPHTGTIALAEARRGQYAEVVAELRTLALTLPETQASAKVGAYRAWLDGLDRLTDVEQALGYLPRDLHLVGDDRIVLDAVLAVFTEHGVNAAVAQDLAARLDSDGGGR